MNSDKDLTVSRIIKCPVLGSVERVEGSRAFSPMVGACAHKNHSQQT